MIAPITQRSGLVPQSTATATAAAPAPPVDVYNASHVNHPPDQAPSMPPAEEAKVTALPTPPSAGFGARVRYDNQAHTVNFTYDPDDHTDLKNLTLLGSWDNNTHRYSTQWANSSVPMKLGQDGKWHASIQVLDDAPHDWQWGVKADGPTGQQQWAVFEENNLTFQPQGPQASVSYAPTQLTRMGMTHDDQQVNFRYWAPDAQNVAVRVFDGAHPDQAVELPMQKDPSDGTWSTVPPGQWDQVKGKIYAYDVTTSEGTHVLRTDPYGRLLQGQQKGIAQVYLAARTGQEVTPYFVDPVEQQQNQPSYLPLIRFEVEGHSNSSDVSVSLSDDSGHVLSKAELQQRLGAFDAGLVSNYHQGKLNDFYTNTIDDQGRIHLLRQGNAWGALVNNPQALAGLHYRITVTQPGPDGRPEVVGDTNDDGQLSADEARHTAFNDAYSDVINPNYGWNRYNIADDFHFDWKNDKTPRMATAADKMVIYQLHVGSFMGNAQNVQRSSFEDVVKKLQYLKDTGVNTLEMLPVGDFEGSRDWGYMGTNSLGVTDQYGFEDQDGRWVSGREALCRLIDAAHGMGFDVFTDVVYNHMGGNYNDLWNSDGQKNPYFNWDPNAKSNALVGTPWGDMPADDQAPVRQFETDTVMSQFDELHFDGARFDFTNPIHNDNGGGGLQGWTLLRKWNREIHYFHPNAITDAEEFPNATVITQPAASNLEGGAGFNGMWDVEFQHALVNRNGDPPGLLQQAAHGWQTNMDNFMNTMVNHPGFQSPMNQVTIISDHDEVGNADRTVNVAMNDQPYAVPSQWARNASRNVFGVGMLAPGMPMYFEGEESLANNKFTWDVGSTWDLGWDWLDVGKNWDWSQVAFTDTRRQHLEDVMAGKASAADLSDTDKQVLAYLQSLPADQRSQGEYNIMRKEHYLFARDVTHLRESSPAFDGDAAVNRVYTHNDNSVMAYTRSKAGQTYLVVSSLNKNNLPNYGIPTDSGPWQLVLDSDAPVYGGSGCGQQPTTVDGGAGSQFNLPAGGMLVFKKVP